MNVLDSLRVGHGIGLRLGVWAPNYNSIYVYDMIILFLLSLSTHSYCLYM
ncbi:hypothetical protein CsatA_022730 [Cannabis sativa]